MGAIEKAELAEKSQAEQIINSVPRIPEVEGFDIRMDNDWTGDPSFYITFLIRRDTVIDDAFLRRFHAYRLKVMFAIQDSDTIRFPYTSLKKAA